MPRGWWWAAAVVALGLVLAGCQLSRDNYRAVTLGQSPEEVRQLLGAPRYQYDGEWDYTSDDPRDLTRVSIFFGPDKKVVGKRWQNPEKPGENQHEGQVPQP
jgi:outer membrane protein assembly factor BamE (lipoprotein component of BamABCDE complex)